MAPKSSKIFAKNREDEADRHRRAGVPIPRGCPSKTLVPKCGWQERGAVIGHEKFQIRAEILRLLEVLPPLASTHAIPLVRLPNTDAHTPSTQVLHQTSSIEQGAAPGLRPPSQVRSPPPTNAHAMPFSGIFGGRKNQQDKLMTPTSSPVGSPPAPEPLRYMPRKSW